MLTKQQYEFVKTNIERASRLINPSSNIARFAVEQKPKIMVAPGGKLETKLFCTKGGGEILTEG